MTGQRLSLVASAGIVAIVLSSCSMFFPQREREDFIRIQGTQFVHKGAPYYFAGTNMWYGCYLGSPGPTGDRPRLVRELDSLKAHGIGNLRVLAASEESYIRRSVKPGIQRAPGVVNDSLLQGLDFLLAEMTKRDMHAVLYLGNYWEWSGGFSQYIVWAGGEAVDPENPQQGWAMFMEKSATFYSNPKAMEMYWNYVRMIVKRRNTLNGKLYSEDPAIMAWQLVNEPRPGQGGEKAEKNLPFFYRWIDETASLIHTLDTNHLVSGGSEGTAGSLGREDIYLDSYRTPHIDYLNVHLWPLNWGWFDPKRWEETLPTTEPKAVAYINQHIALARKLGKPIVMDEFGLGRDGGVFQPGTSTNARDRYYTLICRVIEDSARAGAPFAGSNFWAWGGEGKAQHEDGMWQTGDSFVGDPPQEPQGRNSIFISDTSTLRIITDHARNMMRIGAGDSLTDSKR